jgi:hypothetical protein
MFEPGAELWQKAPRSRGAFFRESKKMPDFRVKKACE